MLQQSFFNRGGLYNIENKFWLDLNQNQHQIVDTYLFISEDLIYSGYLYHQEKDEMVQGFYKLYRDRMTQQIGDQINVMFFHSVKFEAVDLLIEDQEQFIEQKKRFLLFFYYQSKDYCHLYANNEEEFLIWFENFKQCCILGYFNRFYKNISVMGKGSFAKVIQSLRIADKQEFAVKTFNKFKLTSQSNKNSNIQKEALMKEIRIMRLIQHENIIKLHEVYEGEFHIYLVLELLKGGELFDRVIKKGFYQEEDSCKLIKQLLKAIEKIHSMGIIHRDIKPENLIFLSETTYELKLADFGLAEFKGEKNPLFVRCGTPGYVAPEVLKDEPYTEKVDIFATGIILYILLTGCTPFFGETYNEIIDKNQDGRVNYNFEEIGITVSDEALNLLQQLLEIDPNQRISATQALQHEWILKHAPDDEVMVSPLLKKKKKNNLVQDNLKKLMMQNEQVSYKKRPSDIFINSPLRKQGTMDFDDSPTMEENQECASPLIKHNMKVLKKSDSYNKMKKQIRDLILDQQDIKKSFDEPDNLILQKPSTKKENIINLVKI